MATTEKTKRTTAKRRFTRKLNFLNTLLDTKTSVTSIADVNAAFDDLRDAWQTVEEKHDDYASALSQEKEGSPEIEEAETWIEKVQHDYNSSRNLVLAL